MVLELFHDLMLPLYVQAYNEDEGEVGMDVVLPNGMRTTRLTTHTQGKRKKITLMVACFS